MKFHVYQDTKKGWRWRLKARNGRIIADSGEAYKSRAHALRMVAKMLTLDYDTPVVKD